MPEAKVGITQGPVVDIDDKDIVIGMLQSLSMKEYDETIYPMILLEDPLLKNSLEYIKITPTNMMPSKHYGYSAQWFLMFFVLFS